MVGNAHGHMGTVEPLADYGQNIYCRGAWVNHRQNVDSAPENASEIAAALLGIMNTRVWEINRNCGNGMEWSGVE